MYIIKFINFQNLVKNNNFIKDNNNIKSDNFNINNINSNFNNSFRDLKKVIKY